MREGGGTLGRSGQFPGVMRPKKEYIQSCENCFAKNTLNLNDKGPSMKWVCSPKFYGPSANWPWLRVSPRSSLYVIYCLILTTRQWLMGFTCIPVQIEPNKSPLRNRLLALLLWEIGHLSSPSRSCLGRLILICGGLGRGWALWAERLPPTFLWYMICILHCVTSIQNQIICHHMFDPLHPLLPPIPFPLVTTILLCLWIFVCFCCLFIVAFCFISYIWVKSFKQFTLIEQKEELETEEH